MDECANCKWAKQYPPPDGDEPSVRKRSGLSKMFLRDLDWEAEIRKRDAWRTRKSWRDNYLECHAMPITENVHKHHWCRLFERCD